MIKVLKFGGSSVANATNISRVLDIVREASSDGCRIVLVLSAISGCTDALLEIGKTAPEGREILAGPLLNRHIAIAERLFSGAEREVLKERLRSVFEEMKAAPGEVCQTYGEVLSTMIVAEKLCGEGVHAVWLDSRELVAKDDIPTTYANIAAAVDAHPRAEVFVVPGFIAHDASGAPTTLGRGGSDYSAALYAAALGADVLQIWTDVPGIMTANPKDVPSARSIPFISYRAALDMAKYGAKVLYAPTVQPALESGIVIGIRNTFCPSHPGTLIGSYDNGAEAWMGVTSTVSGETALIALVGEHRGGRALTRASAALRQAGISELRSFTEGDNVFLEVPSLDEKAAVRAIHREFFEGRVATDIEVFVAGFGAVGKAFVELVESSGKAIAARIGKNVRVVGISDGKSFRLDRNGVHSPLGGRDASSGAFVEEVCASAARHSVFVDVTDSEDLFESYDRLFAAGISVVTSNRRSLAVPYAQYAAMKASARENGVSFRYETTVGAALPMLAALSRSFNSSDEILSIEAVVSCTLNLILGGGGSRSFAARLSTAQSEGLTERDPRTDLGGVDALRKLLILAREAGVPLEAEDVEVVPVLGPEYFGCSLEAFYARLSEEEPRFGDHQRFVAELVRDTSKPLGYSARIALKEVDESHPAFRLSGTDNAIIIRSTFHPSPLLIEGAGEGAVQAAASVLNDILDA